MNPTFESQPVEALARYFEEGYHVEPPGLWSEAQLNAIAEAANSLPSAKDGTFAPVLQPHRLNPMIHEALKNPALISILERLVHGKVSCIQSQFFFCRPGTNGFALHQDNHYVEAPPDAFVSAWTAVDDVTRHNGCLVLYPRTHLLPILPVEDAPHDHDPGQDKNANRQQAVVPREYEGIDVPVKKGSVVFLHSQVVHSSHRNSSDGFRRALLLTYVREGSHFRPGNSAKRAVVDVYT